MAHSLDKHQHSRFGREMLGLVIQALTEAFGSGVHLVANSVIPPTDHPGGLLKIDGTGEPVFVAVAVIRTAYPRDTHRAIWLLDEIALRSGTAKSGRLIKLVAAEHLSPGAKSTLKDKGYAFFESGGSLFLHTEKMLINIERPSKSPSRPYSIDLFTEAREGTVPTRQPGADNLEPVIRRLACGAGADSVLDGIRRDADLSRTKPAPAVRYVLTGSVPG